MPAGELKVFVSHSNVDNVFTRRLVEDLRKHGANVWVDFDDIDTGDFAATINQGMDNCDWMVAVLTPASLKSKWVIMEVNAAMNMKADGFLKGVVPIVAEPFQLADLPPIWRTLQRYDATKDYDRAFAGLCKALGLKSLIPQNEPAFLTVAIIPSGARVLIDGAEAHGPMSIAMGTSTKKTVVVEVSKYGYLPKRLNIEVTVGQNQTVELTLDEKPVQTEPDLKFKKGPVDRRWLIGSAVVVIGLAVFALRPHTNSNGLSGNNLNRSGLASPNNTPNIKQKPSNERWAAGGTVDPPLTGSKDGVESVAFSPEGNTLATGSRDGTILLWNVNAKNPVGEPLTGLVAGPDSFIYVAFSPDGNTIASAGSDKKVRLWDAHTKMSLGESMTGHTGEILSVAFSPDSKTLATGSWDKSVRLWDVRTRKALNWTMVGETAMASVAFSPNGNLLAIGSWDKSVHLVDVQTLKASGERMIGHTGEILLVGFSPDGNTLATASNDKTIRLWDIQTKKTIGEPLTHSTDSLESFAFSPDGITLATSVGDKTIRLWDVQTRKPIGEPLVGYSGTIYSIAFSPDGNTLAAGCSDKTIRLWHPKG